MQATAAVQEKRTTSITVQRAPYLVYQMGKVGSSSLFGMLRKSLPATDVYHIHSLDHATIGKNVVKHENWQDVRHVRDAVAIRRRMLRGELNRAGTPWKVLTPVREPIGRNLSGFFMNYGDYIPNMVQRWQKREISLIDILQVFLKKYPHHIPFAWFEREYGQQLGLDIFKHPFDRQRGYSILHTGKMHFMLLRTEEIRNIPLDVYRDFLCCDELERQENNKGETKDYGPLYREFKQRVRFPKPFVDAMYDNPLVRHFFTPEQIEALKQKYAGA